jgi:hypothetical protein
MHYNTTLNSISDFSDQWQFEEDAKPLGEEEGTLDDEEDDYDFEEDE